MSALSQKQRMNSKYASTKPDKVPGHFSRYSDHERLNCADRNQRITRIENQSVI